MDAQRQRRREWNKVSKFKRGKKQIAALLCNWKGSESQDSYGKFKEGMYDSKQVCY